MIKLATGLLRTILGPLPCLIAICSATLLFADEGKPAKPSLDEQLLESLDTELLEGLETVPADETGGTNSPDGGIPADVATTDEDAFSRISKRMREAERLIGGAESVATAKKLQKEIIRDLDQLIAELEKQCQKCQGGSSSSSKPSDQVAKREQVKQPSQSQSQKPSEGQHDAKNPAKDATERLGKDEARQAALEKMKSLLREDRWGELPAKAREQMLQLSPEQFLPKYELLIEEYYKRLAERPEK